MIKIGDKFKFGSDVVTVTGKSGDYYRVFVKSNGSMYYDWYSADQLGGKFGG